MSSNPTSKIPAKRFKFSDNQNIIPTSDFYSADFADVLNGDIPGASTATSSLANLTGVLHTQAPGSNLLNSALNDVSAVGNTISDGIGDVASVVGGVINEVGQVAEEAIDAVCGLATDALDDALSIVNTAVGGITGAVSSIFGSIIGDIPELGALTGNCAQGLFSGSLGITGPKGSLCGMGGSCGGVLGSLVSEMTCNPNLSSQNPYSSLTNSLQSNFLSNLGGQAVNSLGINNLLSGTSSCPANPFGIQAMNGFALNTLQNSAGTSQLLDFGNVGGPLATNIGNIGGMVPNALSTFTNNFTLPSNQLFNAVDSSYEPMSVTAGAIQNAYDNISPGWNISTSDGSPSISNLVGSGSSSSDLTNTATYGLYQNSAATLAAPYSTYANTNSYSVLNNSTANNGYAQTYMGMSSGSQNGTTALANSVAATTGTGSSSIFGTGSSNGVNVIQNQVSSLLSSSNSSTYVNGSGSSSPSTTGIFGKGSSSLSTLYPAKNIKTTPTLYTTTNNNLNSEQASTISSILGQSSQQYNPSTPQSVSSQTTTPTITSTTQTTINSILGSGSSAPSSSSNQSFTGSITKQAAQLSANNNFNSQNSSPVTMTNYVSSKRTYQQAKLAASSVIGSVPNASPSAPVSYQTPTSSQITNNLF